jgi:hypothetical protein
MAFKFNPLTGMLDLVGDSSLTIKTAIKAILVESTYEVDGKKAAIIFDEDSILYNDDGAL